ncbi:putative ankyrin repeat protein RF_0381 [Leptopilina boulardi]|uniref:putative ankyrin repeat protein RF_0381 n=1 Tax=Leptopilina boulardi TaxID=63433 RepID=UPI0021F5BEEF|nr:putative ankyrin repeat protein RF_0381 [Leptopilina boulardi]
MMTETEWLALINAESTYEHICFDDAIPITRLQKALLCGSLGKIQQILNEEYNLNLSSQNDWVSKCKEIINICIDREIDVNLSTNKYSTLLHFVAENLYDDFESVLFKCKNFDINAQNIAFTGRQISLIHLVIKMGRKDLVEILIKFGVNLNARDLPYYDTPLIYAVVTVQIEIAEMLLTAGADVNAKDSLWMKPINLAFGEIGRNSRFNYGKKLPKWELINLLCLYGATLDFDNRSGINSLNFACESGNLEEVEFLMQYGADLFNRNDKGDTPLHYAILGNNYKLIDFLLRNEMHVDVDNYYDQTSIHQLITDCIINIDKIHSKFDEWDIPIFIEHQWELEFENKELQKCADMIEFFVDNGASLNTINNEGNTPLSDSISFNFLEIVECLLELKADVDYQHNSTYLLIYVDYIDQNEDVYSERVDTCVLVTAFLATRNVDITEYFPPMLSNEFEWVKPFFDECQIEVSQLKKKRICDNRNISFFDFLFKDIMKVMLFCRNEKVMSTIECVNYKNEFRCYKYFFKKRIERVQHLKKCMNALTRFLKEFFKRSLPCVVVNELFCYLTAGDLRNFGRALCISKDCPNGKYIIGESNN